MPSNGGGANAWPLAQVFAENPAYVRWLVENVADADPVLIGAAEELLAEDAA